MAVALGLVLGLGAAFGLEFLDRRVRGVDDLSEMLQLPVLVVIPNLTAAPRKGLARLGGPQPGRTLPAP
jgi:capsular polysaccharide biosynthesis protein